MRAGARPRGGKVRMAPFSRGDWARLPWPRCYRVEERPSDCADRGNWSDDDEPMRDDEENGGGGNFGEGEARENFQSPFWDGDFCVLTTGHIIDVNVGGQWCLAVVTKVEQN